VFDKRLTAPSNSTNLLFFLLPPKESSAFMQYSEYMETLKKKLTSFEKALALWEFGWYSFGALFPATFVNVSRSLPRQGSSQETLVMR